ncbi:MAG: hypothetical protein ACRDWA_04355 [Acidimicrobiia bacterium]
MPILAEDFDEAEHLNLQLALDGYMGDSTVWSGVAGQNKRFAGLTLSDLIASRGDQWAQARARGIHQPPGWSSRDPSWHSVCLRTARGGVNPLV